MGHQFYKRRAGEWAVVFDYELSRETPDVAALADAGCKVAFFRVRQLDAAGDLRRILTVIRSQLVSQDVQEWTNAAVLQVSAAALVEINGTRCLYPSEAQHVALQFLRAIRSGAEANMVNLKRTASQFFADQISLSEAVFRLPHYGLFSSQAVAKDMAAEISNRVSTSILKVPKTTRDKKGRTLSGVKAPRARARKRKSEEIGNELDI